MEISLSTKSFDGGNGTKYLIVIDGIIKKQGLTARSGFYTGTGNPELVGQPLSAARGMGFRKVRPPKSSVARGMFELNLLDELKDTE